MLTAFQNWLPPLPQRGASIFTEAAVTQLLLAPPHFLVLVLDLCSVSTTKRIWGSKVYWKLPGFGNPVHIAMLGAGKLIHP